MANLPDGPMGGNYVANDDIAGEGQDLDQDDEQHVGLRYAEAECEHCGVILPKNRLRRCEIEREVGRSSGSTRRATSNRSGSSNSFSGKGATYRSSYGTTNSLSSSSGRRYYKNSVVLLCDGCLASEPEKHGGIAANIGLNILRLLFHAAVNPDFRGFRWKR